MNKKVVGALAASVLLGVACGGSAGTSSGPPGSLGSSGALDDAGIEGSAPPYAGAPGDPHTPETGCRSGFEACPARGVAPPICSHLQDDNLHCGKCDVICSGVAGSCVAGQCVADSTACAHGAMCGTECVFARSSNVDHCGSCFNRCGDASLCVGDVCVSGGGDGSSCASPLVWNSSQRDAGFRSGVAQPAMAVFACGPTSAIPTRWFRITGTKAKTTVVAQTNNASDTLAVAVYSTSACDGPVLEGCTTAKGRSSVVVSDTKDRTFFVAVGAVSVAGPVPSTIYLQ